ncbi:MAG: STAS domain-containing protein [Vampirovibrionales bacterium]
MTSLPNSSIFALNENTYLIHTDSRVFDSQRSMDLRMTVQQQFEKHLKPFVIVDLSAVHYMDSFGLAFILSLYRRVQPVAGKVILVGIHANVEQLIVNTKISKILPLAKTVDEALALCGA